MGWLRAAASGARAALLGLRFAIQARAEQERSRGQFGYGAYKDEPWSLQAIEKRVYAVRDFYNSVHVLDNPADAPRVKGALSTLRLLIGYKPTHVPRVRAS